MASDLDVEDDAHACTLLNLDWDDEIDIVAPLGASDMTLIGASERTTAQEIDEVVEAAIVRWASKSLTKDTGSDFGDDMLKPPDDIERVVSKTPEDGEDKERKRKASNSPSPTLTDMRRKKKPKGKPKRPLSAYNIFFQKERPKVLRSGELSDQKVGFQELAKTIGRRWGLVGKEERKEYEELAEKDSIRYRIETEAFMETQEKDMQNADKAVLPKINKLQALEPVSTFGNIQVSTCLPPAPISFLNNTAGPLQARLPWGQPLVSGQQAGPIPSYPFSNQAPHQQQQLQSFMQGMQQQQLYNRASMNALSEGAQQLQNQKQQQQPGPVASQPPPMLMPMNPSADPRQQQSFPIPTGMEIVLPDHNGVNRRYKVQYTLHSMKREDAMQYMARLATAGPQTLNEQNRATYEKGDYNETQGPQRKRYVAWL